MVRVSEEKDAADLQHVVCNVMGQPKDGKLMDALMEYGAKEVLDLFSFGPYDLTLNDGHGNHQPLPDELHALVEAFKELERHYYKQGHPNDYDDWSGITQDEFIAFCTGPDYPAHLHQVDVDLIRSAPAPSANDATMDPDATAVAGVNTVANPVFDKDAVASTVLRMRWADGTETDERLTHVLQDGEPTEAPVTGLMNDNAMPMDDQENDDPLDGDDLPFTTPTAHHSGILCDSNSQSAGADATSHGLVPLLGTHRLGREGDPPASYDRDDTSQHRRDRGQLQSPDPPSTANTNEPHRQSQVPAHPPDPSISMIFVRGGMMVQHLVRKTMVIWGARSVSPAPSIKTETAWGAYPSSP